MESILTKKQEKNYSKTLKNGNVIVVTCRFDDRCGNGKNEFAITSTTYRNERKREDEIVSWGCCHDSIAKHFPELAKYIKWHLCSTKGPMYYVANATYHAKNIPTKQDKWYFYLEGKLIRIVDLKERDEMIVKYGDNAVFTDFPNHMAKESNLDAARSCAVWPEAELEDFTEEKLMARLPGLIEAFKADMMELGFNW